MGASLRPLHDPQPTPASLNSLPTPTIDIDPFDAEVQIRQAFVQGDEAGMEAIFRHYYTPLYSHALRYVTSRDVAEDLVSDLLLAFHQQRRFAQIETSVRAYLFTAVRHRAFDHVRAELYRTAPLTDADPIPLAANQQPDAITQYEELYHDVQQAINALPLRRRQVYVMHRFEGKKMGEIANELRLSLRTVETQLYQAVHQVRAALAPKWLASLLVGTLVASLLTDPTPLL